MGDRWLGGIGRCFVLLCVLQVGSGKSVYNNELPALSHQSRRCPPVPSWTVRGGQLPREPSTTREFEPGSSFPLAMPLRVLAMGLRGGEGTRLAEREEEGPMMPDGDQDGIGANELLDSDEDDDEDDDDDDDDTDGVGGDRGGRGNQDSGSGDEQGEESSGDDDWIKDIPSEALKDPEVRRRFQELEDAVMNADPEPELTEEEEAVKKFWEAANEGRLDTLEKLWARHGNKVPDLINARDPRVNITALMHAAANGHIRCTRWLLENGADPLQKGSIQETAMHLAAAEGQSEVCVELYKAAPETLHWVDRYNATCIHHSADCGHAHTTNTLYKLGAKLTSYGPVCSKKVICNGMRWPLLMEPLYPDQPNVCPLCLWGYVLPPHPKGEDYQSDVGTIDEYCALLPPEFYPCPWYTTPKENSKKLPLPPRAGGATPLQLARDQGRKEVVTLIERHIAGLGPDEEAHVPRREGMHEVGGERSWGSLAYLGDDIVQDSEAEHDSQGLEILRQPLAADDPARNAPKGRPKEVQVLAERVRRAGGHPQELISDVLERSRQQRGSRDEDDARGESSESEGSSDEFKYRAAGADIGGKGAASNKAKGMLDTEAELQSDNMREMKEMMEQVSTSRWRGKEEVVEEEEEEEEKVEEEEEEGVIKGTRKEDDGFDDPDRARAHALRKELAGGRNLKEIMQQFQEQLKLAEADAAECKDFPDDLSLSG